MGLGGSWEDFLAYLQASFASENVKLILGGGSSSAVGGNGAFPPIHFMTEFADDTQVPFSVTFVRHDSNLSAKFGAYW